MALIVLFKGKCQYNLGNIFVDHIAAGFESMGHQTGIIDLLAPEPVIIKDIDTNFSRHPVFVFAINAIGFSFQLEKRSLFDAAQVPFVGALVDHPVYHLPRISANIDHSIITCVDADHVRFVRDYFQNCKTAAFLPHGGMKAKNPSENGRPIDILFGGTGKDPEIERKNWQVFPSAMRTLVEDIVDLALSDNPRPLNDVVEEVLAARSFYPEKRFYTPLLLEVEDFLRAHWRLQILQALDNAGMPVVIFGNGWEFARFKHHQLRPTVDLEESVNLMTQAKTALNISMQFCSGSHERVFSAMLNGAAALTHENNYFSRDFEDGRDILFYQWKELRQFTDSIKDLLDKPKKLREITDEAQAKAERDHTWAARAENVFNLVDSWRTLKRTCTA